MYISLCSALLSVGLRVSKAKAKAKAKAFDLGGVCVFLFMQCALPAHLSRETVRKRLALRLPGQPHSHCKCCTLHCTLSIAQCTVHIALHWDYQANHTCTVYMLHTALHIKYCTEITRPTTLTLQILCIAHWTFNVRYWVLHIVLSLHRILHNASNTLCYTEITHALDFVHCTLNIENCILHCHYTEHWTPNWH